MSSTETTLPPIQSVWQHTPTALPAATPHSASIHDSNSVRQLNFKEQRAVIHIAEGILPLRQISLITGLSQARLLHLSIYDPDFQDQVSLIRTQFAEDALSRGLALRHIRQARLSERAALIDQIVSERSLVTAPPGPDNPFHDPDSLGVPGASTGLLTKQIRSLGSGPNSIIIDEWSLDRPILRELAEIEQQAAREAGQWRDIKQIESTTKAYIGIRIEDV